MEAQTEITLKGNLTRPRLLGSGCRGGRWTAQGENGARTGRDTESRTTAKEGAEHYKGSKHFHGLSPKHYAAIIAVESLSVYSLSVVLPFLPNLSKTLCFLFHAHIRSIFDRLADVRLLLGALNLAIHL